MYKKIDFTKLEGLPLYQDTLDFLQTSYRDAISAIAKALGNRVIVSGVTDQGTTYSDGWVIIDGELMPLVGGLKTSRIIIEDVTGTEVFADNSTSTVYYTRRAKLGVTGGFAFTDFIRVDTMAAISEGLKTLLTAHNTLKTQFSTHTHAWNQITGRPPTFTPTAHRHVWSDIDNKPRVATILYNGLYYIGDVINDNFPQVTFPNVGTSDYMILGHLEPASGTLNNDNDVFWMASGRTATGFTLSLHEIGSARQVLYFRYALISL